MNSFSTTSMSSKGQVVIPEKIRSQLNLKEGSKFIVVGEGDVIILKIINPPIGNDKYSIEYYNAGILQINQFFSFFAMLV